MRLPPSIRRLTVRAAVLVGGALLLTGGARAGAPGTAASGAADTVVWTDTLEVSTPRIRYPEPPGVTLTVAGDTLYARMRTGCWLGRGCIDAFGIVTHCTATLVPTSFSATLHIAIDLVPTEVRGWVAHIPRDAVPAGGTSWCRWENLGQASQLVLLSQCDQQVELELPEGLHVLYVGAAWNRLGNIHGMFLIECR